MIEEIHVEVDWDTDGAEGPPKIVPVPVHIWAGILSDPEEGVTITDWLSDNYGFTHFGWTIVDKPGDFTEEQRTHLIDKARARYARDSSDNVEIDDNAKVILAGNDGAWVASWVFLYFDDLPED